MRFPERVGTARLVLRRPQESDAEAIFSGWSNDPVATRYMFWPRHRSIEDTRAFLEFSHGEWERWPGGPYVVELQATGELVGGCGFAFRSAGVAEIGYILRRSDWGRGYATECVRAQIELADALGGIVLTASVHPDNAASIAVLERCGFTRNSEVIERGHFPNLTSIPIVDVPGYVLQLGGQRSNKRIELMVRNARPDDAAGILSVLNPIIIAGQHTVFDRPFTEEAERRYIAELPARGIFHVAVGLADDVVLGFQSMEPFATYTGAFDHVGVLGTYVDASCRRRGVARALFAATLEAARGKGYEKLFTYIRKDNPDALATYCSNGFRVVGVAEKQAKIGGRYIDEVIVERLL